MKHTLLLLLASYTKAFDNNIAGKNQQQQQLRRSLQGNSQTGTLDCLIVEEEDFAESQGLEEAWYCQDENGLMYEVNRPGAWFRARGIVSGENIITVTNSEKVEGNYNQPPRFNIRSDDDVVAVQNAGNRRRLAPTSGDSTMLVIRGISGDGQPSKSASELAGDVFGSLVGSNDPVNLASQYDACSGGALTFTPAAGTGIQDGVIEVTIPDNISGMNRITAHNLFVAEAETIVGDLQNSWTHTFLVMQNNVDFEGAAAYAYINSWLSVYKDNYATMVVVQMHEIGHNLGLYHSGEDVTYDDHTCMMGNPAYADDSTIQCFNGAKSWYLGWYSEKHAEVAPANSAWDGELASVNDFVNDATSSEHTIVLRIDDTISSTDLYVMYNKQEGVNSGVKEYGDKVTVVSGANGGVSSQSYMVAHLSSDEEYRQVSFSGTSNELVVKVCSLDTGAQGTARVLVYLDGVNNLSCDTVAPTTAAPVTAAPSAAPATAAPATSAPTLTPVAPTTPVPTSSPVTSPPVTLSPVSCPVCENGESCCESAGFCKTNGNPRGRGCILSDSGPSTTPSPVLSPTGSCPVCENGDSCCSGSCITTGKKSGRGCTALIAETKSATKCFSGLNTVLVQDKGEITMDSLEIGDMVETSKGYSRVFSFGHLSRESATVFLQIATDSKKIEISEEHIVMCNERMMRAQDVKVGDRLENETVQSIDKVQRRGFYAPTTENGEIIVSGIRASCFAALLDISPWIQHVVTHMFHAPLRLICSVDFDYCGNEQYDSLGFSSYLSLAVSLITTLASASKVVQIAAISLAVPFLVGATVVVELISQTMVLPILLSLLCIVLSLNATTAKRK